MKQFSLVLTGGKTVTYNQNDIEELEAAYQYLTRGLMGSKFITVTTDDGKDETVVNVDHLIAINVQYD